MSYGTKERPPYYGMENLYNLSLTRGALDKATPSPYICLYFASNTFLFLLMRQWIARNGL